MEAPIVSANKSALSRLLLFPSLVILAAISSVSSSQAAPSSQCAAMTRNVSALTAAKYEDGPAIAPTVLVADLDTWLTGLRLLNPDPSLRADTKVVNQEAARIRKELTKPMSRREAWLHFAKLNPYLRDAHGGIQMPDYREALEAHLKAGGHVVPLEVRFAKDGTLRVFTVAADTYAIKPGDRLLSINGHEANQMIAAMMSLSIGDTPRFQRAFLARRFAMLFWYLYGDTGQYDVAVQSADGDCPHQARMMGGTTLPEALQSHPRAEELFNWRILSDKIGYLRIDSFDPDQKDALNKVTHTAFAAFKEKGVRAVIIDVRENGGGDDPLWQQDVMNHFTTKPYVQLSHYIIRITKDNADPGDVIGTVQSADYNKRFTPPTNDPVRFNGPVYILGGPYSYSATIQFIVAAQDFGLAKIAGEQTAALSCQTGQVKHIDMPWTGLSATTPIIAYTRPSRQGCQRGVMPDVPIAINEVRPEETLNALANWIDLHPSSP
jgi:C-terminal processing protease CtpA/Prc